MKRNIFYLLFAILLSACQQEELPSTDGVGYLSLENITVQAANIENIVTRAVDKDLYVKIDDGAPYPPGADLTEIAIEAGTHTIEAYNAAYTEFLGWTNEDLGSSVYYCKEDFEIEADGVKYVNMEVPMTNFGVRLSLPEDFSSYFNSLNDFSVTVGNRTVSLKDGETAYFPYSAGVSVNYTLSVTNKDNEPHESKGNSSTWGTTLESGTVYVITYDYATRTLVLQP